MTIHGSGGDYGIGEARMVGYIAEEYQLLCVTTRTVVLDRERANMLIWSLDCEDGYFAKVGYICAVGNIEKVIVDGDCSRAFN